MTEDEDMTYRELSEQANILRRMVLDMVYRAGSGHIGGSLSAAEIMTVLYFHEMHIDSANPRRQDRDRFVLSKGHATPIYYATLATRGFFPMETLEGFRKMGSILQGHPDRKHIPGVDMSSGSLGQGISTAVGMALAAKLKGEVQRVYVLLGDGEIQEGQVWEACMFAAHNKLDNLCVIIDNNDVQSDGPVGEVNSPYPIDRKLEAFNFNVITVDGHDVQALAEAFEAAKRAKGKPTAVIAKTVKGKGVSFMEGQPGWHGKAPNRQEYELAVEELGRAGA